MIIQRDWTAQTAFRIEFLGSACIVYDKAPYSLRFLDALQQAVLAVLLAFLPDYEGVERIRKCGRIPARW